MSTDKDDENDNNHNADTGAITKVLRTLVMGN